MQTIRPSHSSGLRVRRRERKEREREDEHVPAVSGAPVAPRRRVGQYGGTARELERRERREAAPEAGSAGREALPASDRWALHGSRPKRKAETAPAARSRKAPPAAKPAVISRSFLTLPIREPSSS